MPPTLFKKGALLANYGISKKTADSVVPIEYILSRLKESLVEFGTKKTPDKITMSDRIFIIRARTGSGKSTALPVYIYRLFNPSVHQIKDDEELITSLKGTYRGRNIAVTQPRVLTAIDIPTQLADHTENPWSKDMILGETIGYSTGTKKVSCSNCILYMTLDTLLMQLRTLSDEEMRKIYRVIILDEVHERSITLDIVIMLVKSFIKRSLSCEDCPIIIFTSATFDVDKYARYLDTNSIIDVEGLTFPIKEIFLKNDAPDYYKAIYDIMERIHVQGENVKKEGQNDVLIFVPSVGDCKNIKKILNPLVKDSDNPFMYSLVERGTVNDTSVFRDMELEYDKMNVDEEGNYDPKGKRKASRRVFIGTTVAETGITIGTLGFIIDTGYVNQPEIIQPYNIGGLIKKPIAKSQSHQRLGRVGRKFEGVAYYLYTEATYKHMANIQLPTILIQNIRKDVITILSEQMAEGQSSCFEISKIDMLDPPAVDSLKDAVSCSIVTGLIGLVEDGAGCYDISKLGKLMLKTQFLEPEHFRMIQSAYLYNVSIQDMVTIISMTMVWRRPYPHKFKLADILGVVKPKYIETVELFQQIILDQFIEELCIFNAFSMKAMDRGSIEELRGWCESVGLKFEDMIEVIKVRSDIFNDIMNMGFNPLFKGDTTRFQDSQKSDLFEAICNIKQCIYDGYRLNLIVFDKTSYGFKDRFGNNISNPRGLPVPKDYRQHCNNIVTNKIKIDGADSETMRKVLGIDRWSVLDGYIGIDYEFLTPNI